jgi:hypothetical protein
VQFDLISEGLEFKSYIFPQLGNSFHPSKSSLQLNAGFAELLPTIWLIIFVDHLLLVAGALRL